VVVVIVVVVDGVHGFGELLPRETRVRNAHVVHACVPPVPPDEADLPPFRQNGRARNCGRRLIRVHFDRDCAEARGDHFHRVCPCGDRWVERGSVTPPRTERPAGARSSASAACSRSTRHGWLQDTSTAAAASSGSSSAGRRAGGTRRRSRRGRRRRRIASPRTTCGARPYLLLTEGRRAGRRDGQMAGRRERRTPSLSALSSNGAWPTGPNRGSLGRRSGSLKGDR
jgi:hypothetical protein